MPKKPVNINNLDDETLKSAAIIGEKIRLLRVAKGLSQRALGRIADVTNVYIIHIETGTQNVSIGILKRIADALGVPIYTLLPDEWLTGGLDEYVLGLFEKQSSIIKSAFNDHSMSLSILTDTLNKYAETLHKFDETREVFEKAHRALGDILERAKGGNGDKRQ